MCYCKKNQLYQLLPSKVSLSDRPYCSLSNLRQSLNYEHPNAKVYSYVIRTICRDGDYLWHYGSGPNWQGGIITLCTCKHYMRTFHRREDWPGKWVAGFSGSGIKAGNGKNVLIYLMRVKCAYESHWELWQNLPEGVSETKATDKNPLGDVYRPLGKETQQAPFNVCRYHQPNQSHSRRYDWPRDIHYKSNNNCRRAALLVGDRDYSFIWNQRKIVFDRNIGRGQRKDSLKDFLEHLQEANQRKQ